MKHIHSMTAGISHTAGFVRHHANTGMVFAGTGTVWKIPTRGIPVPNPRWSRSETEFLAVLQENPGHMDHSTKHNDESESEAKSPSHR